MIPADLVPPPTASSTVPATYCRTEEEFRGGPPGAFVLRHPFDDPNASGVAPWGMAIRCPCCGEPAWLPLRPKHGDGWTWSGDRERPTLAEAIHIAALACQWQGHLVEGEWRIGRGSSDG